MNLVQDAIQIIMSLALIVGGVIIVWSLLRMHRDPDMPNLMDLLTTTDKRGNTRLDARKCWEAGAFMASTWGFFFMMGAGKMTEWYFMAYMGTWVGARFLRDREQRLDPSKQQQKGTTP